MVEGRGGAGEVWDCSPPFPPPKTFLPSTLEKMGTPRVSGGGPPPDHRTTAQERVVSPPPDPPPCIEPCILHEDSCVTPVCLCLPPPSTACYSGRRRSSVSPSRSALHGVFNSGYSQRLPFDYRTPSPLSHGYDECFLGECFLGASCPPFSKAPPNACPCF